MGGFVWLAPSRETKWHTELASETDLQDMLVELESQKAEVSLRQNRINKDLQDVRRALKIPGPDTPASTSQSEVGQTAFIHKLYNMLEDSSIRHLISWTPSGKSFIMSPNIDFSRVLSQHFRHTNISSFIRQLNRYGFHKVSDVFDDVYESPFWEFKHENSKFERKNFLQGQLRDTGSFPYQTPNPSPDVRILASSAQEMRPTTLVAQQSSVRLRPAMSDHRPLWKWSEAFIPGSKADQFQGPRLMSTPD